MDAPQSLAQATQARQTRMAGKATPVVTPLPAPDTSARLGSSAGSPRVPPQVKIEPLRRGELMLSEHSTRDWHAIAAAGSEPSAYDGAAMWGAVAESLSPFDHIFLVERAGRWWALLVCAYADKSSANCKLVLTTTLPQRPEADEQAVPEGYEIIPGDISQSAFVVRRKSDGFLLSTDIRLNSKREALTWLLGLAMFRDAAAVQYFP